MRASWLGGNCNECRLSGYRVVIVTFAGGVAGLYLQRLLPEQHSVENSRDMIGSVMGLVTPCFWRWFWEQSWAPLIIFRQPNGPNSKLSRRRRFNSMRRLRNTAPKQSRYATNTRNRWIEPISFSGVTGT
jgi:hypothetical protein